MFIDYYGWGAYCCFPAFYADLAIRVTPTPTDCRWMVPGTYRDDL